MPYRAVYAVNLVVLYAKAYLRHVRKLSSMSGTTYSLPGTRTRVVDAGISYPFFATTL